MSERINGKLRVPAVYVYDVWGTEVVNGDETETVPTPIPIKRAPGTFSYYVGGGMDDGDKDKILGLLYVCPCGCDSISALPFNLDEGKNSDEPAKWNWNGNMEKPTLTPSIRRMEGCKFHGHLVSGIFAEC